METPEQRAKRFDDLRESIVEQLIDRYPDISFDRHKYGIDIIFYVVDYSTLNGINICPRRQSINTTIPNLDKRFLTKKAAHDAISIHIPAAKEKFKECLAALNKLKEELNFEVDYCVHGDTHGISDYPYISFTINGFDFTFAIE